MSVESNLKVAALALAKSPAWKTASLLALTKGVGSTGGLGDPAIALLRGIADAAYAKNHPVVVPPVPPPPVPPPPVEPPPPLPPPLPPPPLPPPPLPPVDPPANTVTLSPSGADDTAAIQAAVNARGTNGGSIVFKPGTYVVSNAIRLPAGNAATLTLSGYGATIKLTNSTPRFLVWNRTALHQTFRKFSIEGFAVDANNNHPASGSWSILGFDMYAGSIYNSYYLNIEAVTVKDCTVKNIATSNTSVWNSQGINFLVCQDSAAEATQNHITDVLVQACRIEGGPRGVSIFAGGPDNLSVTIDRVYIRDCWHDTLTTFVHSSASSNYHIGQSAMVGTAEVTGCYGNRSGDVGVEIDNTSECLVENCTMDNPSWEGFFYTNFNEPMRGTGSITWRDCHVNVTIQNAWGAGQYGYKAEGVGYPIGTVNLKNCDYKLTAAGPDHRALAIGRGTALVALNVDGLTVTNATTLPDSFMVYLAQDSGVIKITNVFVDGARLY